MQYNLHYKNKQWLEQLAIEMETAIMKLQTHEQDQYTHIAANNLTQLTKNKHND